MKDMIKTEKKPCFIIAEAGVNHNGDLKLAYRMIDAAKSAGADAVKFQTFITENVVTKTAEKADYQKKVLGRDGSQYEMIKSLELSHADFQKLSEYAHEKKILFLSSPFDFSSVDFLDQTGVSLFKIPSGEITNIPFIKHIASKKRPVILSTGMATLGEIERAVNVLKNSGIADISLLHCVTSYPAKATDLNLEVIRTLQCTFRLPVGFSDHSIGKTASIAAVAMGAVIIEKHFTLDKSLPGPDHSASASVDELTSLISEIRVLESAIGDGIKRLSPEEEKIKQIARRSLVAGTDIEKGSWLSSDLIAIKRPGTGIAPIFYETIRDRRVKKDIKKDTVITWDMIE